MSSRAPTTAPIVDLRTLRVSAIAIVLGLASGLVAQILVRLIGLVTNLAFFGRFSLAFTAPTDNRLGPFVIVIPVLGGLIVGVMARYGSPAIRGHGIPEAMEQVLLNESRIPPRVTLLKPLSAAISIGTGGPFGAEGPIIATGGALGSLLGQLLETTGSERKALLAAGAAAGMAATFGSPVSAVLLAVELLLFEFRARSLIPVCLASAAAAAVRLTVMGSAPIFAMPEIQRPSPGALVVYVGIGAAVGLVSVWVTRAVYLVEDAFDHLPVHWMWWPAIGAVAVGVVGFFDPRTLGVGYDNISLILSGALPLKLLLSLCLLKFLSWVISLGSGTSGGTLAPLFTIGGALGGVLGLVATVFVPGIDGRVAALVGMASMFAGASRGLLASIVFAFETTLEPLGLLPLLGGCTAAYLVSALLMRNTIMTEKIARRGVRVPSEYEADYLDRVRVGEAASRNVVAVSEDATVAEVREWINSGAQDTQHQGFPVVSKEAKLVGIVTRRYVFDPSRKGEEKIGSFMRTDPPVVYDETSLREAADHMVEEQVGRLPVVDRADHSRMIGIVTRGDMLNAHKRRLAEGRVRERSLRLTIVGLRGRVREEA
jgi:H+/Cl- antiporter ClcA